MNQAGRGVGERAKRAAADEAVVAGNRPGVGDRERRGGRFELEARLARDHAAVREGADRSPGPQAEAIATARGCGAAVGQSADGCIGENDSVVARDAAGVLQGGDRAPFGNECIVAADDRTAELVVEGADRAGSGHGPVGGDSAGIGDRAERAGCIIQDATAVGLDPPFVGERGRRIRAGGDHP